VANPIALEFATPRRLPRARTLKGRVVVLDVAFASDASGGGFNAITRPFIDGLGDRLALWVDHHDHQLHPWYQRDPRFVLHTKAEHGACPEIITEALVKRAGAIDTIVCHTDFDGLCSAAKWLRGGVEPYPGADDDARAVDTRIGTVGPIGLRIDRAIRGRSRDHGLFGIIVRHLASGLGDNALWQPIDAAATELEALHESAREIAKLYKPLKVVRGVTAPNGKPLHEVMYVEVPANRKAYDKYELLLIGQQRASVAIVVDGDGLSVAAPYDSSFNFLELLTLSGGMPTLVSVHRNRLADLLNALQVEKSEISEHVGG
jgi:hypothetical protein